MADRTRGDSGASYDPAEFIIPAQDHQGHSERVWCRVQPLHERQVDKVLSSKQFPFRTKGDVVRWCVVRGLRMLENMEPSLKGFIQQADAIQDMLRDEAYMQDFMQLFETLQKVVNQHTAMGAPGEAVRLVAQVKFKIDQIEGEPTWKRKCQIQLKERFGHLLSEKPVGLDTTDDDHDHDHDMVAPGINRDGTYKQ